jgi:signal transduction histidine kinase
MERAFEPFQKLSDTLSREYQGMGLGLAIARCLANTHGGSLHLESTLGGGTSAILTLPLCDDDLV